MPERAALLVTGTVGAGKTTTAEVVGDLLREATVPNAVVDLDRLSATWPAPPEDRFNLGVQLRNLRDVSRNYLDAGVRRLVLAGVVETPEDRGRHAAATGLPLTWSGSGSTRRCCGRGSSYATRGMPTAWPGTCPAPRSWTASWTAAVSTTRPSTRPA